jgi:F1F0 ATPase subunit 2
MTTWLGYIIAFIGGLIIGGLYYGGLWWTVRRLHTAEYPPLLLALSFLVRLAVAMGLFYLVAQGSVARLGVAFLAFILMRFVTKRRWGPDQKKEASISSS